MMKKEPTVQTPEAPAHPPLLALEDLRVYYRTYRGAAKVVEGVNLELNVAEKIALVGESGCGKTTTMKTILRLLSPEQSLIAGGAVRFEGRDVLKMSDAQILELRRRDISMISQEPMAALNPVFTVGEQLADVVKYAGCFAKAGRKEVWELCVNAVKDVLISDPERILRSYPHQLSGGMRQRICIAMALITPRKLLIADEPGTALDVTIQDQIHRLLRALVEEKRRSLIMITHSLGVARELVDRIYIMYAGQIVEQVATKRLFERPLHPYTAGLIDCVPRLAGGGIRAGIYGYVPDYIAPPAGCRFCPRCPDQEPRCATGQSALTEAEPGHFVACFKYGEAALPPAQGGALDG